MKKHNVLIPSLLFIGCFFTNVQAAESSTKCPPGPALVHAAQTGWGDSVYHAEHYCIMSKRPGKGQTAKLISGEQANSVTSRYSFVFEKLQTDQERVIFIDEFIQRFSRVAWLTVIPKSEGFSDLTISAQRNSKQYHLGINIFQGLHETLLPKLDNFIVNERASAEVPQHISALIHFVITGIKTATPADSPNDSEDLLSTAIQF